MLAINGRCNNEINSMLKAVRIIFVLARLVVYIMIDEIKFRRTLLPPHIQYNFVEYNQFKHEINLFQLLNIGYCSIIKTDKTKKQNYKLKSEL